MHHIAYLDAGSGSMILLVILLPLLLLNVLPSLFVLLDVTKQPEEAFGPAGVSRTTWIVLPVVGLVFCIVGIVSAIVYYSTVRPKLIAAIVARP